MKCDSQSMLLYVVTDRRWLDGAPLETAVEQALLGGATFLQLREKALPDEAFLAEALTLKTLAKKYEVPLVINDNIDVAIKADADGVHVGQSDMIDTDVRARIGPDKILGISANTVENAIIAEKRGADYIGVGAVFGTTTKEDAQNITIEMLRKICDAVSIPVVAIGGINETNILALSGSGIDGVAVISAIFSKPDICAATKRLKTLSATVTGR